MGFWKDAFTRDLSTGLTPQEAHDLERKRLKEIADRPKVVPCKACGKEVARTAPSCPHCGENAPGLHIKCPKCSSMSIATGQKGFGLGKAAAGLFLLGPAGLLGGMVGRKKIELVCLACGKRFEPNPMDLA
jgi:hypothetical protein